MPYRPDRELAAEAITAQATRPIDFPAVIDQAYADGFRVFLEMGPGASCTRLIDRVLGDRPHLARSVCLPGRDALSTILEALGNLIACRVAVNLEPLYGRKTDAVGLCTNDQTQVAEPGRLITVEPGPKPPLVPQPPRRQAAPTIERKQEQVMPMLRTGYSPRHPEARPTGRYRGRHGRRPRGLSQGFAELRGADRPECRVSACPDRGPLERSATGRQVGDSDPIRAGMGDASAFRAGGLRAAGSLTVPGVRDRFDRRGTGS